MAGQSTEATLRTQIKAILDFGVTKRALAERLDVHESWLGRWLAGEDADVQVRPISVPEMDRFQAYVRQFLHTLQETQRSAASAEPKGSSTTGTAGGRFRS